MGSGDGLSVVLPHCWNDSDGFLKGVAYYRGPGAYRWQGQIPTSTEDGSRWFIETDGFYGTGTLFVNGRRVGPFDGSYLGLHEDITPFLQEGQLQHLAIRLTNRCASDVLPGIRMPDFLLYGGLSGFARLVRRPPIYCDEQQIHLRCEDVLGVNPVLRVTFGMMNASPRAADLQTVWQIHDPEGQPIGEASRLSMEATPRGVTPGELAMPIAGLPRWHVDDPTQHLLHLTVFEGDREGERFTVRFGIRHAEFRPREGFFLNGQRVALRGCNRHESMPGFGRALPARQHREDAMLIKDMGMNFVRLSHYPQHPAFMDACDELGILVFPEVASWKSVRTGRWLKRAVRQMREMILRDRNRPAIILWGMGNESRSRRAFEALRKTVHALDPDRPVTYAENHLYRAKRDGTLDQVDVWGCNYELDVLDEAADYARTGNALVTECSNTPSAERGDPAVETEQAERILNDLAQFDAKPHVAGYTLWCFNDYATFRKQRYLRFSGIVDAWRLPKRAAVESRDAHNPDPTHLHCPDLWNAVAPGGGDRAARLDVQADNAMTETVSVLVFAVDDSGAKHDAWSGDVHVSIDGPGRLHTLGNDGTVWVRAGVGRCFVTRGDKPGEIRLTARHHSLTPGKATLPPGQR